MKISQMTADQASDALARLTQPISNIVDDDDVNDLVVEFANSKDKTPLKIISSMLPKVVPLALRKHKKDLYEIVGVLAQKNVADVGKMTVLEIMTTFRESVDQELMDFFKSSDRRNGKTGD
jgi:hypothetical protein